MGLLDGLLGNASKINIKDLENDFETILIPKEEIVLAFKVMRDLIVFTSRRLILVDKQGITGKKVEYHSIPYKSISHFAVETSGSFDRDAELKIWLSGHHDPIKREFRKNNAIIDIQKALAMYILV